MSQVVVSDMILTRYEILSWVQTEKLYDCGRQTGDVYYPNSICTSCGDGIISSPETCDDGNSDDTDPCRNDCAQTCEAETRYWASDCSVPGCGSGSYDPNTGQECNDGNLNNGDGCDSYCRIEDWRICFNSIGGSSFCIISPGCGNGVLDGGEVCDDGNGVNDDGCEDDCTVTPGWSCPVLAPAQCFKKIRQKTSSNLIEIDLSLGGYTFVINVEEHFEDPDGNAVSVVSAQSDLGGLLLSPWWISQNSTDISINPATSFTFPLGELVLVLSNSVNTTEF